MIAFGRPELVGQIRALIRETGPITFARFMELALYAPGLGYYASLHPNPVGESGALADFQTSPQVHPIFGDLLAAELLRIWRALGCPDPFVIAEPGAGVGELARQILAGLAEREPGLVVVYHAVDARAPEDRTIRSDVASP
ncbi:MAG TPA: SAM-dependent methyltransferase, partial [Chloroflexota bacterium]|nr:SAM-dependent methyltransferase [Chloroflexota bacterium]